MFGHQQGMRLLWTAVQNRQRAGRLVESKKCD